MKMTITSKFLDAEDKITIVRVTPMGESGYASVEQLQRDRLTYYRDHPRERAEKIERGVRVTEKQGWLGLRQQQDIELA